MALPKVWWPEPGSFRTMLFHGDTVKMDDIGKAFAQMEQDMVKIWEKEILLGFKLRVDYDKLVDNMSNTEVGYSLFSDPRNACFKDVSMLLYSTVMSTAQFYPRKTRFQLVLQV